MSILFIKVYRYIAQKGLVYKNYKLRDFYYTNEKGSLSREIYDT